MKCILMHLKSFAGNKQQALEKSIQFRAKLVLFLRTLIADLWFLQEMAVVKYVGRTDFAGGIWLGLELRNPKGKHDGQVNGRRYFQTKALHGIMIRPKMVSVHGINGELLLKPETEYPF